MLSISGYRIIEKINDGKSSDIYRGIDENNQKFILKVLKNENATSEQINKIINEYEIIKNIQSDGVIKTYGLKNIQGKTILILEDFNAISLKKFLKNIKTLNIELFLKTSIKIVEALEQIHKNGIIHRDIKPENILINPTTLQIKFIDFGFSSGTKLTNIKKYIEDIERENLKYVSPEQTGRTNQNVDIKTDFYSLGIIFYEMLTGNVPFDSDDNMEIIHQHIAKKPLSPYEINYIIPQPISQIVMKMLEKNANQRYKSSYGIIFDLKICLENLINRSDFNNFTAGKYDIKDQISFSDKTYAKEHILEKIISRINYSDKNKNLIFIKGESGLGKTFLLKKILKTIDKNQYNVLFIKCEKNKINNPYACLIEAISNYVNELITQSQDYINYLKEKIKAKSLQDIYTLLERIPQISLLIENNYNKSQSNFNSAIKDFISLISDKETPLIIIIDDPVYTDSASAEFVQRLMIDESFNDFSLIISSKKTLDNSKTSNNNVFELENEIIKTAQSVKYDIYNENLSSFTQEDISSLISDSFDYEINKVTRISSIIYSKTQGNPFFVTEFIKNLYEKEIIFFQGGKGWIIDEKLAKEMPVTKNVIDVSIEKIQLLSKKVLDRLKVASCIGQTFETSLLSMVFEEDINVIDKSLKIIIKNGILAVNNNVNYFIDERIRDSIYSMIDSKSKSFFHYKIGKTIKLIKEKKEENLFESVRHLNLGLDYIVKESDKIELSKMNLELGKKSKKNLAYTLANDYFKIAIDLINNDIWDENYDLSFELYIEYAQSEYLSLKFNNSEKLLDIAFKNAHSNYDKALICNAKTVLYLTMNKIQKSIEIGLKGLEFLKIKISQNKYKVKKEIAFEYLKSKYLTRKTDIENIINLPFTDNKEVILAINLMISVGTASYMFDSELMFSVFYKMLNLSLKNGNSQVSPYVYAIYASLLSHDSRNFEKSYKLGKVSLELLDIFESSKIRCKVNFLYSNLVHDWSKHDREDIHILTENINIGVENGDLLYAGYSALHLIIKKITYGDSLDSIYQLIKDTSKLIIKTNNSSVIEAFLLRTQLILSFKGLTYNYETLSDKNFNEKKFFYSIKKSGNTSTLAHCYSVKMIQNYFFENYTESLEYAEQMKKCLSGCYGNSMIPEFYFFYSLSITSLCIKNPKIYKRHKYLSIVKKNQLKMKKWSESCPESFLARYLLVEAEINYIYKNNNKASELYNKAIDLFGENNFIHYEALANELSAKFYLSRGHEIIAKEYINEAYLSYKMWGANLKLIELEKKYYYLFDRNNDNIFKLESYSENDSKLDLETIMKAYQTLSEEIFLDKLTNKLMKIVLENAGAERGVLILKNKDGLSIESEGNINNELINVSLSQNFNDMNTIPHSIVNYVERTGNDVVIENVMTESVFTSDPYIISTKPKSILCIPINKQQSLIGLLYLENSLIEGAFTQDRIRVLKLIASQAAISIENAKLYDEMRLLNSELEQNKNNLSEIVDRRTKQLKLTQKKLIDSAHRSGMAEIATGVLHNIGNILNNVNISNQLISETLENSKIEGLVKANDLLNKNIGNISEFLTNDPRGKKLFQYYISIGDVIKKEMDLVSKESQSLSDKISLMKDVIVTQQSYAKVDFLNEKIDLITVVEDALSIQISSLLKNNVKIVKNYNKLPEVTIQKSKLINILINLLKNSEEALESNENEKIIKVELLEVKNKFAIIKISDNGEGIIKENINKIFNHGFTTKMKGHGFGLHICANSMTEMNGQISVTSGGLNQGSTFELTFPI